MYPEVPAEALRGSRKPLEALAMAPCPKASTSLTGPVDRPQKDRNPRRKFGADALFLFPTHLFVKDSTHTAIIALDARWHSIP